MTDLPTLLPIRIILAATDLSPVSVAAVRAAAVLAKAYGAELHLVHALDKEPDPVLEILGKGFLKNLQEEAEKELNSLGDQVGGTSLFAGIKVKHGKPVDMILEEAGRLNADLLVLGTHGRTGVKHIALGSVAEHMAANAPLDVLLVRMEREQPFSRPIVALKNAPAAKRAAARALELMDVRNLASLDVITAFELPLGWHAGSHSREEVSTRMRALTEEKINGILEAMRESGKEVRAEIREGSASDVVLKAVEEGDHDVLFVGSYNRSRWTAAFLGDTSRVFAHKAPSATWLVRDLEDDHPVLHSLLKDLGLE